MSSFMEWREHPELDVKVAEEALGWDLDKMIRKTFDEYRQSNIGKGMHGGEKYDDEKDRDRMLSIAIPHFSSDISAAMGAAEETSLFKRYSLSQLKDGRWVVEDICGSGFLTPALAICYAILKEKEVS